MVIPSSSKPLDTYKYGLVWIGLDWIGLDWIEIGLDWIGLDWICKRLLISIKTCICLGVKRAKKILSSHTILYPSTPKDGTN